MWIPFFSQTQVGRQEERPRKRARKHAKDLQKNPGAPNVPAKDMINTLPPEILMEIFDLTLPPRGFLRARPFSQDLQRPKPHSAWRQSMDMNRAIIPVCKMWCQLGRRLLYRDVTILDLHGLNALWWAIYENPSLGLLVRSLSFMFAIDGRDDGSCEDIGYIILKCPRVQRVDLFPFGGSYPPHARSRSYPFPAPPTVTSLGIGSHVRLWDFAGALVQNCSAHLQELRIPLAALLGSHWISLRASLPQLHTIQVTCSGSYCQPIPPRRLAANWKMPQLKRVTFRTRDAEHTPEETEGLLGEYKHFLQLYGQNVEYLQFPDVGDPMIDAERNYGPVLALCPLLQHVVLPIWATCDRVFSTVKQLDLWCSSAAEEVDRAPWPNVEIIRRFDVALRDFILDAPVALDARAEWDTSQFVITGLSLVKLERNKMSDIVHIARLKDFEGGGDAIADGAAEDEQVALALMQDDSDSSSSDEDSDSEPDSDEPNMGNDDGDLEEGDGPRPKLKPGLRRFLQATMPKRVFIRFERAVLGMVVPAR
ncbi:hypothetical protein K438DRAFT_1952324 [Mycena galopus ATCC 62051]|nr:hypothetical protein K438DRAFT_1952324 [Mycena galopus ATCC 62051]